MATISFQSNQIVDGTAASDELVGNDTAGNNNDLVYGHQGNDTITFDDFLNNSTLYGGQGDDEVIADNGSALYGNFGNDELFAGGNASVISSSDALYGGQGNDFEETFFSTSDVLYGNLGNDFLLMVDNDSFQTAYGGQGQDTVEQFGNGEISALYGNQGNDFVEDIYGSGFSAAEGNSFVAEGSSTLYGGQGNDRLIALGAGGDAAYGGAGDNLYVENAFLSCSSFSSNDMLTVQGFVSGNDELSMSNSIAGQDTNANAAGFLTKIEDTSAANAADAIADADNFYENNNPNFQPGYVFVYGGSGAGYLFYNSDNGGVFSSDGITLAGDNAEGSLQATDIVASNFAA